MVKGIKKIIKTGLELILAGIITISGSTGCTTGLEKQDPFVQEYKTYVQEKIDFLYTDLIDVRAFWQVPGYERTARSYFIPKDSTDKRSALGRGIGFSVPAEAVTEGFEYDGTQEYIPDEHARKEIKNLMGEGLTRRQIRRGRWIEGLKESEVIVDDVRIKSEDLQVEGEILDVIISPIYNKETNEISQFLILYLEDHSDYLLKRGYISE